MRLARSAFCLLAASAVAVAAGSPGWTVADLGWIAGSWCAESEATTAEEHWLAPHGGVLLGVHRDVRADGGVFFEFLRIVEEGGELVYYASPAGRPATPFTLVQLERVAPEGWRAVFANPEHDFPQRIVYEASGDELTATIEGEIDGETRSRGWRWRKDACGFLDRRPSASG